MQAIRQVLAELFAFVFKEGFGLYALPAPPELPQLPTQPLLLPLPPRPVAARAPTHQSVYTIAANAPLEVAPTETYDGVILHLPYGTHLAVTGQRGRWYQVEHAGVTGWVSDKVVTPTANAVYPHLTVGHTYHTTDPITEQLRACLGDPFTAARLSLPLLDAEYVSYRLLQAEKIIPWPPERPRLPGRWHQILKRQPAVHSQVAPAAGAIMEWMKDDATGQLAWVEAVAPDQSVRLSLVGHHTPGQYTEETLTHEDWRELRPVFITVS
jgi:hypothetical protein